MSSVQLQEELVPRLEKLHLAGKVSYSLTPGTPQDVGSAGGVSIAGSGQVGTSPAASLPSAAALAQQAWYINATTGNDNNTGTAAAQGAGLVGPIKTAAEYLRRTGLNRPIANPVALYIAADLPATDPLIVTGTIASATGSIRVVGTNLTVAHTGTLTAYTAPVAAANTFPIVQDTAVATWTPYAGMLLRLTSGVHATKDAMFWVKKDLTGDPPEAVRIADLLNRQEKSRKRLEELREQLKSLEAPCGATNDA